MRGALRPGDKGMPVVLGGERGRSWCGNHVGTLRGQEGVV